MDATPTTTSLLSELQEIVIKHLKACGFAATRAAGGVATWLVNRPLSSMEDWEALEYTVERRHVIRGLAATAEWPQDAVYVALHHYD